jgi:enamine deaminase RidA (YjgF/YER057c/UK114 family)
LLAPGGNDNIGAHKREADVARKLISSGSSFEKAAGYSRAVVDGEWVFVSGTTGFDYAKMAISEDLAEQVRQTLRNIAAALEQAGSSLRDVVRANYIVPNPADWPGIVPILGEHFGEIRPASTAIIAGLVDPRMRIEIEVTARRAVKAPVSSAAQRRRTAKPKAKKKVAKRAGKKGRR